MKKQQQKFTTELYANNTKDLNGVKNDVEICDKNDDKNNDENKMESNVIDTEIIMKSNNNNTKVLNNNNHNEAINLSVSPKSASSPYMSDNNDELSENNNHSSDDNNHVNKIKKSPSNALMYKLNHTKKSSKRIKEIELQDEDEDLDDCDMKNDIITNNNYNKSQLNKLSYISQNKDNTNDLISHSGGSEESSGIRHTSVDEIETHENYNNQQNNNINNNNNNNNHRNKKGKSCFVCFILHHYYTPYTIYYYY